MLSSIWIPIETAKIKKRNEPLPSVPLGPSPRLVTAKVLIRGALNSKDAQRLQAALANAKAVDSSMGDDELKALIVEAQKAFAPLEASWKKSKRDAVQREEAELISALTRATKEKNEAAILAALLKSQGFRVRTGTLSSEHLKAQATAKETIQRIEIASRRKAMRRYEGSPVGIAVGNLEIRRSFDGYTFDGSGRFVSVFVSAMNSGADSEHINPTNFTLETDEGETVPYSSHTFSSRRPLEAVNIGPGATTSGWIVFESVLSRRYRLIHQPMGGERVVKVLVP